MESDLGVLAALVLVYAVVSNPLKRTPITPSMVFVGFGLIAGPTALGLIQFDLESEAIRILTEATLVLVLFTDAARIDLRVLARDIKLPARLLALGLPLTIAAGTGVAYLVFDDLSLAEAALLGTILAPTDAALGQVVVSSSRVPVRIRTALNVESGLNDGIALPAITMLLALVVVEEDLEPAGFWIEFVSRQIGFGVLIGAACGLIGGWLIDRASTRGRIDGVFRQLATLAIAGAAYSFSTTVDGNGFIAAFSAGIALGWIIEGACEDLLDFSEDEGQLLSLLTMCVFGSVLAAPLLDELTWQIALYVVASLTVVRMIPVAVALVGSGLRWDTVVFIGWFGPRGLASIVFGLVVLEEADVGGSSTIITTVMMTVLVSVFAHGATALPGVSWFEGRTASLNPTDSEMLESTPLPTRIPPID